jgi:hypothetical protein
MGGHTRVLPRLREVRLGYKPRNQFSGRLYNLQHLFGRHTTGCPSYLCAPYGCASTRRRERQHLDHVVLGTVGLDRNQSREGCHTVGTAAWSLRACLLLGGGTRGVEHVLGCPLVQNLGAVCMACLPLLRAVARLLSPELPPRRYKFYATYGTRWTARLRSPCGAQWPRGSRPSGGLTVCRARPQPPVSYRVDNIPVIPGQRLQGSKRR